MLISFALGLVHHSAMRQLRRLADILNVCKTTTARASKERCRVVPLTKNGTTAAAADATSAAAVTAALSVVYYPKETIRNSVMCERVYILNAHTFSTYNHPVFDERFISSDHVIPIIHEPSIDMRRTLFVLIASGRPNAQRRYLTL